jgi:4-amino-4-deoxy-L-arabinose transferase-like glycosyltransferase
MQRGSRWSRGVIATLTTHPWQTVLLVALIFRIAVALPALGDPLRFFITPDSFEYDRLAINLVAGNGYSQAIEPPYVPDVRRTPILPLVIAAVYALVGHAPGMAVAANVLLGGFVCVLTVVIGRRLFGAGTGFLAGLLVAVDLTSAAYSLTLMTETLFTVLLLLCVLGIVQYSRHGGFRTIVLAAFWCGAVILTRPIGLFLPFVLAPALAFLAQMGTRRARLVAGSAFVILALLFPAAWTARNYVVAGVAQPTSIAAINLYYHRAADVEAHRQGVPTRSVRQQFAADDLATGNPGTSESPEDLAEMQRRAFDILLSEPVIYLRLHLGGAFRLLEPEVGLLYQFQRGRASTNAPPTSVSEFVVADTEEDIDVRDPLFILGSLQLTVLYVLALAGLVVGLRNPRGRRATMLLLVIVMYFILVSGPEAYPRFRVPVMPFVALLAAEGARALYAYLDSAGARSAVPRLGEGRRA